MRGDGELQKYPRKNLRCRSTRPGFLWGIRAAAEAPPKEHRKPRRHREKNKLVPGSHEGTGKAPEATQAPEATKANEDPARQKLQMPCGGCPSPSSYKNGALRCKVKSPDRDTRPAQQIELPTYFHATFFPRTPFPRAEGGGPNLHALRNFD